jgi:hypothetical protein
MKYMPELKRIGLVEAGKTEYCAAGSQCLVQGHKILSGKSAVKYSVPYGSKSRYPLFCHPKCEEIFNETRNKRAFRV